MTVGSSYRVDANIFNKTDYVTVGPSGETLRGDWDADKLGWTSGNNIGSAAKETVTIPKSRIPNPNYWKNVGTALGYQVYFQAKEKESGYQHVQLTTGDSIDTAFYPESGKYKDRDTIKISAASLTQNIRHFMPSLLNMAAVKQIRRICSILCLPL